MRLNRLAPMSAVLLALLSGVQTSAAGPGWMNVSPGAGGPFTCVGAGPTGIIIAGSDISGAYRSADRGQTWTNIGYVNGGLEKTHVNAIAFDPDDATIVYLGVEGGLYRSIDGGDTFSLTLGDAFWSAITVAPSDPNWVYAVCHSAYNTTDPRIYRSTDRGVTWSFVGMLPTGTRVLKLRVRPNDPTQLFAVSGYERLMSGVQPRRALYVSGDGGATWSDAHGDSTGQGMTGNPWDAAYDPEHPDTIYATSVMGSGNPDVSSSWTGHTWRGHQAGGTWQVLSNHTGAILARRVTPGGPVKITTFDVRRDGPGCTECGPFESNDSGVTWAHLSDMSGWDTAWINTIAWCYNGATSGVCKTLGQDQSDPAVVFWGTPQFLWMSSNWGASFANVCTDEVAADRWVGRDICNVAPASLSASGSMLYAGLYDLGIWRSLDSGFSWQPSNDPVFTGAWAGRGGNCMTILTDPARPEVVWAAQGEMEQSSQLIRSVNSGEPGSWTTTTGLPSGFINGLSLDTQSPTNNRTLYVTSNGDVYKSVDDGQTWALAFDCDSCYTTSTNSGFIVFAGGQKGLWRSLDYGTTWAEINSANFHLGWSTYTPSQAKWNGPHDTFISGGLIYVAVYGKNRGIYKSTDLGTNWTRILADDYARTIHRDAYGGLYAGSSSATTGGGVGTSGATGIQLSLDGGANWSSLNAGLPWPFVWPIISAPGSNSLITLIIGTPGSGVWRAVMQNGGIVSVDPPRGAGLRLAGFRPNPAAERIAVAFSLPAPGPATLDLFDLAGRRLVRREVGSMGPGDHVLPLGAEVKLPPGVYIVRLTQGGRSVTARAAVVR